MSLRKKLSDSIREAKDRKGYTYDEIVLGSGCSKSAVRYALNGGEKVGIDMMEKMLKFLGFSVGITLIELLNDEDFE